VARIDYYDDPAAPAATSLVPSANVVVVNDDGALLVIHRTDNDNWAFPGGAMDLGESLVTTAVREVKEETGIDCEITGLVGIYTDPKHIIFYTARPTGGTPTPSSESREVVWVPRDQVLDLRMDRSMRMRVQHYLDDRPQPYLG
jgi:8-oxo-dGTP pyrophosphatase MutT (NUDIX family)